MSDLQEVLAHCILGQPISPSASVSSYSVTLHGLRVTWAGAQGPEARTARGSDTATHLCVHLGLAHTLICSDNLSVPAFPGPLEACMQSAGMGLRATERERWIVCLAEMKCLQHVF